MTPEKYKTDMTTKLNKSVCLRCNKPIEAHLKITAEIVEAVKGATYENPIMGFYAPVSTRCIGMYQNHDPLMSKGEITWATPFGTSLIPS